MIKKLSDVDNILPFSGERDVNIAVTCRTVEQASLWFNPGSIFARTAEEYLEILKEVGLEEGKEYRITKIDGVGDMFDVIVEVNGKEISLLDNFFIDTYCNSTKITYTESNGIKKVAFIENKEYYAQYIERIKKIDSNAIFEEIYLTPKHNG